MVAFAAAALFSPGGVADAAILSERIQTERDFDGEQFNYRILRYAGERGEKNDLRVDKYGLYRLVFRDRGVERIKLRTTDCRRLAKNRLECDIRAAIEILLNDQRDRALVDGSPFSSVQLGRNVFGGSGDDVLMADTMAIGLSGGPGNDRLVGSRDGDERTAREEGELLPLGRELHGGPGNDVLLGREGSDTLHGDAGEDVLLGGEDLGADRLDGGGGDDRLYAAPGGGYFQAGPGDDILVGSRTKPSMFGNDTTYGPYGVSYGAGSGDDTVFARNGQRERSVIDCGRGRDRVRADAADRLTSCERRLRRGSSPAPASSASGSPSWLRFSRCLRCW